MYSKDTIVFWEYGEHQFVKQCQNCTFKVNFLCQKSTEFFRKKKLFKIINLGDHFLKKLFFLTSIFEALYFLKLGPIFDELALPVFSKYNGFLWVYWFLAKNLAFLGPTIFKIPQPNWYYWTSSVEPQTYNLYRFRQFFIWLQKFSNLFKFQGLKQRSSLNFLNFNNIYFHVHPTFLHFNL